MLQHPAHGRHFLRGYAGVGEHSGEGQGQLSKVRDVYLARACAQTHTQHIFARFLAWNQTCSSCWFIQLLLVCAMLGASAATDGEFTSAIQVGIIIAFNAAVAAIQLLTVAQGRRLLSTPLAMLWNVPQDGADIPVAAPLYSTTPVATQPGSAYANSQPMGAVSASPVPPPPPPNTPRAVDGGGGVGPLGGGSPTADDTLDALAASASSAAAAGSASDTATAGGAHSTPSPRGGGSGSGSPPFASFLLQFRSDNNTPATVVPYPVDDMGTATSPGGGEGTPLSVHGPPEAVQHPPPEGATAPPMEHSEGSTAEGLPEHSSTLHTDGEV